MQPSSPLAIAVAFLIKTQAFFYSAQSLDAVVDIRWDLFVSHRVAFSAVGCGWLFSHSILDFSF